MRTLRTYIAKPPSSSTTPAPRGKVARREVGRPGSVSWLVHQVKRRPYGHRETDRPRVARDDAARPPWLRVVVVLLDETGLKVFLAAAFALLLRWLAVKLGVPAP